MSAPSPVTHWLPLIALFLSMLTTIGVPLMLLANKVDKLADSFAKFETRLSILEYRAQLP